MRLTLSPSCYHIRSCDTALFLRQEAGTKLNGPLCFSATLSWTEATHTHTHTNTHTDREIERWIMSGSVLKLTVVSSPNKRHILFLFVHKSFVYFTLLNKEVILSLVADLLEIVLAWRWNKDDYFFLNLFFFYIFKLMLQVKGDNCS